MKKIGFVLLLSASVSVSAGQHGKRHHGAHHHGEADLDMAFDGKEGEIEFRTPADGVIGFEHEAKSEKDKKQESEALEKLKTKTSEMFQFEAKLNCKIEHKKTDVKRKGSHADLTATYKVICEQAPKKAQIKLNIEKIFPHIKETKSQILAEE